MEVKQIYWEGKPTHYFLFDNGDLYNTKTHRSSFGAKNHGYIRYTLQIDGETYSVFKHRLLAEYFLENDDPENKVIVHHKDGDPSNNDLSNLQWVTYSENSIMKINPPIPHEELIFTEDELKSEIWKPFEGSNYSVSSLGRLRNNLTDKILIGGMNKRSGYIRWRFYLLDGKRIEIQAHRAVYQTFHPNEEIQIINHKDSNRRNNRLSNLENISQKDNVYKSYYETRTKKTYPLAKYDLEGNLLDVYPSLREAARQNNISAPINITHAIRDNKPSHDCFWRKITWDDYDNFTKE